jgi:hypothetical protein
MNPSTTDHPLASRSSWFDTREHPRLSFLCSTLLVALALAPFVLVRLYYYAISDIGAEPNPFLQPWWALFWGSVIAFFFGVCAAIPVVWVGRLLLRAWRRQHGP